MEYYLLAGGGYSASPGKREAGLDFENSVFCKHVYYHD